MRLFDLTGRVALVTGASRGIGKAIAEGLAAAGAAVAVVSRNAEALEEVAVGIRAAGGRALTCVGDMGKSEDIDRVVDETVQGLGGLHILVNNAAISTTARPGEKVARQSWDEMMQVNLRAVFLLCQAAANKAMIPQRYGRIINVTSVLSEVGMARSIPYSPAKAGLRSLSQCLAADWACHGIHVNCLAPGFVETVMNAPARKHEAFRKEVERRITLGRWGTPEDMKGPAIFLASPAADFITGATLLVDGGMSNAWNFLA